MVAAAILAGGQGLRMGGAVKPFLVVDGRPIIERQLAVLRASFDAVVVVAADRSPFVERRDPGTGLGIDVILDRRGPGLGPLAGLDAALAWLPPEFEALVCVAGDMPFLAPRILECLRDTAPLDAAAVVPRLVTGPQPLCARYHRTLAPLVAAQLDAGTRAMHVFLDQVEHIAREAAGAPLIWIGEPDLRRMDPTLATFTNINTPADLLG